MKTVLLFMLAMTLACMNAYCETEPNNTIQEANNLAYNGSQSGVMTGTDTEDWFVINVPQGGIFNLTVKKTGGGNGTLFLYDGDKTGFPEIGSLYMGFGDSPTAGWNLTIPVLKGKYYAKFLKSSDPVNYQVNASLALPLFNEDTEPNDTITMAVSMPLSSAVSGTLHYYSAGKGTDGQDWYKIQLTQGGILNLKIHKKGQGNTWIRFRDGIKSDYPEISNYYTGFSESPAEGWAWSYPVLAGIYYFQVEGGGGVVDYKLDVTLAIPAFKEDTEPNDTVIRALVMPVSGSVSGTLHYYADGKDPDMKDWYKIQLTQGGILNLKIHKKGQGNTWIRFRDGIKTDFPEISNYYTGFSESPAEGWTWSYPVLAGNYYFQVEGGGGVVDYKLDVALVAPAFTEDIEPNDTVIKALIMPVSGSVSGNLHYYTDGKDLDMKDWYKIQLTQGGILNLKIHKKGQGNTWIHFRDGIKTDFPEISNYYTGFSESPAEGWTWSYPVLAGNYYFQVEGGGGVVDYKLDIQLHPPFWWEDKEPNDSMRLAVNFPLNDSIAGILGYYKPGIGPDNWDWFIIKTPEYGNLSFNIEKKGYFNGNIRLLDSINDISVQYLGFGDQSVVFNKIVPKGKYYLLFQKYEGDLQYKVRMKFTPKPKANFTHSQTDNSFTFENTTSFGETYSWKFDDGTTAVTVNPIHEYLKPGNYNVCMIANNIAGADTICQKITIPGIDRILPTQGGNTGDVTIEVFGGGLDTLYKARLVQNGVTKAFSNYVGYGDKSAILASFDLHNMPSGLYDVIIEKKGGPSYTLPNNFNVVQGIEADPWVTISGGNRILFNTWTTYTITYGNNGNVDATGVPLWIVISNKPGVEIDLSKIKTILPTEAYEWGLQSIEKDLQPYTYVDSLFDEPFNGKVYAYMIPFIAPGVTKSFPIKIKTNEDIEVMAWVNPPYYRSPFISDILECAKTELFTSAIKDGIFSQVKELFGAQTECLLSILDKVNSLRGEATREDRKIDGTTFGVWIYGYGLTLIKCGLAYAPGTALASTFFSQLAKTQKRLAQAAKILDCARLKDNQRRKIKAVSSLDPNEKIGLTGLGAANYISLATQFPYTIYFENKSVATAPAHQITISDKLDPAVFDLKSFSFGKVTIGDSILYVPSGLRAFTLDLKLSRLNVIARVTGKLDTITGNIEWLFRSLDPKTLDDVEDPDIGILPPNITSPVGEGNVTYMVKLKNKPQHGQQIKNKASIVFDANPAIVTNEHVVTFDLVAPQSAVHSLSSTTSDRQFNVKWSGTDDGSGIESYNIYVKNNNSAYNLWLAGTKETSAIYKSSADGTYHFSSMAIDKTGNIETLSDNPDATINVLTAIDEPRMPAAKVTVYPVPSKDELTVKINIPGRFTFRIIGTDGRVRTEDMVEGQTTNSIKTNNLHGGLYIWQLVNNENAFRVTGKFEVIK